MVLITHLVSDQCDTQKWQSSPPPPTECQRGHANKGLVLLHTGQVTTTLLDQVPNLKSSLTKYFMIGPKLMIIMIIRHVMALVINLGIPFLLYWHGFNKYMASGKTTTYCVLMNVSWCQKSQSVSPVKLNDYITAFLLQSTTTGVLVALEQDHCF